MKKIIYFDESGNTGEDLLNIDQPIFVLASVKFSTDEIDEIHNLFKTNAKELHFKKINKNTKNRKAILSLLNHKLFDFSKVKISLVHKRFSLYCRIIDLLVEPKAYDINRRGENIFFANRLFFFSQVFWSPQKSKVFEERFQKMIREKSKESVLDFFNVTYQLWTEYKNEDYLINFILQIILKSENDFYETLNKLSKYYIDLQNPSFICLCHNWFKELKSGFSVTHDKSKQGEFWNDKHDWVKRYNEKEKLTIGYGNRTLEYPLKIDFIDFPDSVNSKGIQVADLVASSIGFFIKRLINGEKDEYLDDFLKTKAAKKIDKNHLIMPNHKFRPFEESDSKPIIDGDMNYLVGDFFSDDDELSDYDDFRRI